MPSRSLTEIQRANVYWLNGSLYPGDPLYTCSDSIRGYHSMPKSSLLEIIMFFVSAQHFYLACVRV